LLLLRLPARKTDLGEGILVSFGNVEQAGGDSATPDADDALQPSDPSASEPDDLLTQDSQDAPEAVPDTEKSPTQAVAPERQVDRAALFPGRAGAGSQGASEGAGQQGSQQGVPGGDPAGSGLGASGSGFDLAGRSIVGSLPLPDYPSNESGRVIVDIIVDADGRVTSAIHRSVGTTIRNSELINAAVDAARRARFNVAEGASDQRGTITYNFRLK
jgi:TonB family protein